MKTTLLRQTSGIVLLLLISLAAPSQPAPRIDPATGLPAGSGAPNQAAGFAGPRAPILPPTPGGALRNYSPGASFDPTTGLLATPAASAEPQWIDPSWSDPNILFTNINYENLPLSEVARDLRERFKNYFDILPMPRTFDRDWGSEIAIQLQMKNIKASDVFNAMNLVFENDRTPLRWELKVTGFNRQVVLLRVLPEGAPQPEPMQHKPVETRRLVFFIGNLLGDEKSGGMDMKQIFNTISTVWPTDFGKLDGVIQFHEQAQLLVVNGTRDQIDFIQQILSALREKSSKEHAKQADSNPSAKAEADIRMRLEQTRQKELQQMQKTQDFNASGPR